MSMDTDKFREDEFSPKRYWFHLALWSLALIIPLTAIVVVVVAIRSYLDEGAVGDLWTALIAGVIFAVVAYPLWKTAPDFTMGEPHTPRGNRVRWQIAAIVIVGIAASVPITTTDPGGDALWSNSPLPPVRALIACILWGIAMPVLILFGRRNADEHARASHDFAMMVGGQVFTLVTPIWWIGWRGGFLPEPDAMQLFVAFLAIVLIANMWKLYK
ncbi:hypothetical protein [Alteriqipengyuania sp. 357]